ncbi:helix-turn-helix transcriptional regulator [Pseudohongiella acticola]|jgi:AraC-like DNA-binding protein|uniref:helix-turn-helix domain-containing protein n=1 Tax=Pseudohongiella acticola TaxID=1524254 RepID=UPI0030EE8757
MQWIHSASSYLAISQLMFLASLYLVYFPGKLLSRLIVLFSACIAAYILSRSMAPMPTELRMLFSMMATLAPAVLWIIARYLFEDHRRIHPAMWTLICAYIAIRVIGLFMYDGSVPRNSGFFLFYFYIPQLFMLFLACHVVYMACRGRDSDLIESRRQVRVPFAIGMGSIVGLIIGTGFFWIGSPQLDSLYFLVVFVLILSVNLAMFRFQHQAPHLIQTAADAPAPKAPTPDSGDIVSRQDQVLIDRILKAMQEERLYAESGLTIGDLAAQVSVQEYRLRRLINQSLHYRNFNQFLNHYRIEEAARRLLDPAEEHIPISSIALDVGYASLSSFNKAFKDTHGVTPSTWRASGQPTSAATVFPHSDESRL